MCLVRFFFSFLVSQTVCDDSLASLGGKNKARVFVRSGCGRLGNGGSHDPPSTSETCVFNLHLFFFFFIELVVMEWKTVYLYSHAVNLGEKSTDINILFFTIVKKYSID